MHHFFPSMLFSFMSITFFPGGFLWLKCYLFPLPFSLQSTWCSFKFNTMSPLPGSPPCSHKCFDIPFLCFGPSLDSTLSKGSPRITVTVWLLAASPLWLWAPWEKELCLHYLSVCWEPSTRLAKIRYSIKVHSRYCVRLLILFIRNHDPHNYRAHALWSLHTTTREKPARRNEISCMPQRKIPYACCN